VESSHPRQEKIITPHKKRICHSHTILSQGSSYYKVALFLFTSKQAYNKAQDPTMAKEAFDTKLMALIRCYTLL